MTYLSIIEKFKILFESLFDFKFILVFMILLIVLTFLFGIRKLSTKKYTLFMFISFFTVFGISIMSNYKILSNTFDNFTTIFFENIYFPSIYVYISVLVISFIAFITSLLNKMMYKIYKIINTSMFVVNNSLFVIILNIIAKNKIDIFSVNSLYTNTSLVAILELSMGLCVLWILALTAAYLTNVISERLACKKVNIDKKQSLEVETFNPLLEVAVNLNDSYDNVNVDRKIPVLISEIGKSEDETINCVNEEVTVERVINEENHVLEDIVIETNDITEDEIIIQNNVEDDNVSKEDIVIETINDNNEDMNAENKRLTFNDILNGCIPVNYYENYMVIDEYTLYDPQKMYEDNYNKVKCERNINDVLITNITKEGSVDTIVFQEETKDKVLPLENLTNKENVIEERLHSNTVSLNDLIDDEEVDIYGINNTDNINNYTVDDYKKMAEMLNAVRTYSNNSNINIDDAVAISLIRNYSVDDCLKFKNILENNLN